MRPESENNTGVIEVMNWIASFKIQTHQGPILRSSDIRASAFNLCKGGLEYKIQFLWTESIIDICLVPAPPCIIVVLQGVTVVNIRMHVEEIGLLGIWKADGRDENIGLEMNMKMKDPFKAIITWFIEGTCPESFREGNL